MPLSDAWRREGLNSGAASEREGLLKTVPGFHPAGALRATKFVPDKLVEPSSDAWRREGSNSGASSETSNPALAGLLVSGGEGDCSYCVLPCLYIFKQTSCIPYHHWLSDCLVITVVCCYTCLIRV